MERSDGNFRKYYSIQASQLCNTPSSGRTHSSLPPLPEDYPCHLHINPLLLRSPDYLVLCTPFIMTSSSRQSAGSPPCSRHRCHNRTTLLPQTVRHVAHVPHDQYGFLKSMRPKDIYSPRTQIFIPDSVWR